MKIAITLLSGTGYGGLTYCMNLIPALAKVDKINEYHIFVQKDHPVLQTVQQGNFIFHKCGFRIKSVLMRSIWEQLVLPFELKRHEIDIIFTAKNVNILFAPCKTIIAIQNMGPFYHRRYENHWRVNALSWLLRILTKISIKKADRVIVVSQSNKEYLERFFPELNGKVALSRNGNPIIKEITTSNTPGEKDPFLLTASKFVAYANQSGLIEGYSLLCQRKKDVPPLWFAGGVYDIRYFKKIQSLIKEKGLTEKVKILGFIPHERLIELYLEAFAFIFPSTIETCPMVLIEAMACQIPIATSNTGPMPEVCGNAAVYFNPFDKNEIADKIELLLFDESLRNRLKRASLERSQFFNWDEIAAGMVKVFDEV